MCECLRRAGGGGRLAWILGFAAAIFSSLQSCYGQRIATNASTEVADVRLGPMNVSPTGVTLSGFLSGGVMAQQLQIAHSSLFHGIATFSDSYYRCGPGDGVRSNFATSCTTLAGLPRDLLWTPALALTDIDSYFRRGLIEDPTNLRGKRLYVFAGTQSPLFTTDQTMAVLGVYEPYIMKNAAIRTRVKEANLTFPSQSYGGPCAGDSTPNFYISNCDLSGAYEALNFLLGDAAVPHSPKHHDQGHGGVHLKRLLTFDQSEFFYGSEERYEMDALGFLYVPSGCRGHGHGLDDLHGHSGHGHGHGHHSRCHLHIYFHGCNTGREFVGQNHILNSGYLEVAELNNIVMVFPQVLRNGGQNPEGCWDTFGHTGPLFATQRGAQVTAVRNMLARIFGEDEDRGPQNRVLGIPVQAGVSFPRGIRAGPVPRPRRTRRIRGGRRGGGGQK